PFPIAKRKREACMAKIDLDSLGIEELAALRESATDKLMEKVATRRAELEAELEKLSQYGKLAKKTPEKTLENWLEKSPTVTPVVKTRKSDERMPSEELTSRVAKVAWSERPSSPSSNKEL